MLVLIGLTLSSTAVVNAESDPPVPMYYPGDFWSSISENKQNYLIHNWCTNFADRWDFAFIRYFPSNGQVLAYFANEDQTTIDGNIVRIAGTADNPIVIDELFESTDGKNVGFVPAGANVTGSVYSFSMTSQSGNKYIDGYMKINGNVVYVADGFPSCIAPSPTPTPTPTPGESVNLFPSNDLDLAASSCLVSLSNVSGDFTLYSGTAAVSNADQSYKNPPIGTDSFTVQLRQSSSGWQASLPAGYSLFIDGQSFAGGGVPSSTWRSIPAGFPAASSDVWRVRVDVPTANADGTFTGYVRLIGPASVMFSDQVTYYPVCQRVDGDFSLYGDDSDLEQVIKDEHEADREQSQQQHEEIMDTNDNGGFASEGNQIFTEANEKFTSIFYPIQWSIDTLNSLANVSPKSSFTLPGIFTDETWEFNVGIVEEKLPQLMTMVRSVVLVFVASVLIYGLYNTITGGKE